MASTIPYRFEFGPKVAQRQLTFNMLKYENLMIFFLIFPTIMNFYVKIVSLVSRHPKF